MEILILKAAHLNFHFPSTVIQSSLIMITNGSNDEGAKKN
jgi:hypothetical protein